VFENKVLRRIFGCKREEVMGGLRKLCSKDLYYFHSSPNNIGVLRSRIIWVWYVMYMGDGWKT
jgi:hypothetical protein